MIFPPPLSIQWHTSLPVSTVCESGDFTNGARATWHTTAASCRHGSGRAYGMYGMQHDQPNLIVHQNDNPLIFTKINRIWKNIQTKPKKKASAQIICPIVS